MGQICNTVTQSVHSIFADKHTKYGFTPWDFIPEYGKKKKVVAERPKKQTVEEMKSIMKSIANHFRKGKKANG
jgi:hypothetical protein